MSGKEFSIAVPASTANLGPGFDSIGLALDLHLNIHVSPADSWQLDYKTPEYAHLSGTENNLILQAAERTAAAYGKELPAAKLEIDTDIPLGRGSAAARQLLRLALNWPIVCSTCTCPTEKKCRSARKWKAIRIISPHHCSEG